MKTELTLALEVLDSKEPGKFSYKGSQLVDEDELVMSNETMTQFLESRKNWNEMGRADLEGNFLFVENLQVKKGERRCNLYVVELNGKCYSYKD